MDASKAKGRIYRLACHLQEGIESGISAVECSARRDSKLLYARQGTDACGRFMRPVAQEEQISSPKEARSTCCKESIKSCNEGLMHREEEPLYGKPSAERKVCPDEAPLFARTISNVDTTIHVKSTSEAPGIEWSPRMDVVESGSEHVVTVELPGVNVQDIRVEIEHGKLVVSGTRSRQWWSNSETVEFSSSHNSDESKIYYRRDLSYGPYRAVWTLPKNGNFSAATAEFIDGFLRVVIPKA